MFAYIKGTLEAVREGTVWVDVGGVGYLLSVSGYTLGKLPSHHQPVKLFTYFRVREDAMELYGFLEEAEKGIFELLLTVSGVGPKAALSILSVLSPSQFPFVIASGDSKSITKAVGVGVKLAQRVVLELKDKVKGFEGSENVSFEEIPYVPMNEQAEAVTALVALGYSGNEAQAAVKKVALEGMAVEGIIKAALKQLI